MTNSGKLPIHGSALADEAIQESAMRRELLLPPVGYAAEWQAPRLCPYARCGGRQFQLHQVVGKPTAPSVCAAGGPFGSTRQA